MNMPTFQGASGGREWHTFFVIVLGLVALPVILLVAAYIPFVNAVVFSGHGGPGWLLLPFCFPLLVVQLALLLWSRKTTWRFAVLVIVLYLTLTYPLASVAQQRITAWSGLPIESRMFYRVLTLPIGLLVPPDRGPQSESH